MSTIAGTADLTTEPVGRVLPRLAVQMMLGGLALVTFNLVDTFYVGCLGRDALAAIAFTFPVVFVVISLSVGMAVGTSAAAARAIGQGNRHRVRTLTTAALLLTLVTVSVVSLVGWCIIEPVFSALGAEGRPLSLIRQYMQVWYLGAVFMVAPVVGNGAIRALGDARTPSRLMILAAVLNMVLDPLLIFGIGPFPRLELAGAAAATVSAYAVSFSVTLWVLACRERLLVLPRLGELLRAWRAVFFVGGPAMVTTLIAPLATAWLTRLAASQGASVVAALGVMVRIEILALIGIRGLGTVLTPFMGQNLGAGLSDRIRDGYRFSVRFSVAWGLAVAVVLGAAAPGIAHVFTRDPSVRSHIVYLLWAVPITYGFAGWLHLGASAANGLGRPMEATLLNGFRLLISVGLITWLGTKLFGTRGLFASMAAGNLASGAFAAYRFRRCILKHGRANTAKVSLPTEGN